MDKVIDINVGRIKILAFNDYTESQDAKEFFGTVTDEEWDAFQQVYPECITEELRIKPWPYYCYLVKDGRHTILVDAGVGGGPETGKTYSPEWIGSLPESLASEGIKPEDITELLFTHFHGDHVGWATTLVDGKWKKTFPNARYIARQADYDAYHNDIIKFAFPEGCFEACIQPLYDSGEITLITDEKYQISDSVYMESMPGHTPGSSCIVIQSEGMQCILTGDCIANPLQVTAPEKEYIWDADKPLAAKTKKKLIETYAAEGTLIGGCHFRIGRVLIKDGKRYLKEV